MSFLEIFALVASSVTIFGLIVGVFSVYNGRMTQRLIRETHTETLTLIRETRELIARASQETRELIAREEAATRQLIQQNQEATREILLRITEILGRIEERVR